MHVSKSFLLVMIIFSLVWLLVGPTPCSAKIYQLTILHTGDHRGHFAKFSLPGNPDVGGMAARSTLVNIVRAEVEQTGGYVLLLSSGYINIGAPESNLLNAEPDFKLMKMLGYDAMTLGHGDFCKPREVLLQQKEWAGFPFLLANFVKKRTGELLFEPYLVKEFDGLNVAIFGLAMELIPTITIFAKDVEGRSVIETANILVPTLRAEADVIIALTNLGLSEIFRSPGDRELAQAVPGIDAIARGQGGGMTFTSLEDPEVIGETLIVQAGAEGLYIGRLDLTIDSEAEKKIIDYAYTLLPVNLKEEVRYRDTAYYKYVDTGYLEDPEVLEFIQPYLDETDALLSQQVGEALVRLDGDWNLISTQETTLMNLITDGMRAKTGAEIAMINAGAIRASIEPGPITYREILTVHPYGNTLILLDMTGEQVMEVLNYAATFKPGGGNFLHVSGVTWTKNEGFAEDVLVGGTPIERDRVYKVVITSFLAGGGDGHRFNELPQFNTGFLDADATRDYIMKTGTVAPKVEGRLTIIE